VTWHGCALGAPGWFDPSSRVLSFTLGGSGEQPEIHVILNMDDQELDFELPPLTGAGWRRAFDHSARSSERRLAGRQRAARRRTTTVYRSQSAAAPSSRLGRREERPA